MIGTFTLPEQNDQMNLQLMALYVPCQLFISMP